MKKTRRSKGMCQSKVTKKKGGSSEVVVCSSVNTFMDISRTYEEHIEIVEPTEVAEVSLIPLMRLGHMTNIGYEDLPHEKALQYLELERLKQQQTEADKDMEDRREQLRISFLK